MKSSYAIAAALLLAATLNLHAQGSLTPPPGAPAPVMKTLDQVEPRTPVTQTTCPGNASAVHVISAPGSYYLTANVATETLSEGISINASNVTLDLNGFSIIRLTGSGGTGLSIGGNKGIRIRNGSIVGGTTQTAGVFTLAGWYIGVGSSQPSAAVLHISDVIVRGVRNRGIFAGWSNGNLVERCLVDTCGEMGITCSFVTDTVVRNASDDGINAGNGTSHAVVKGCFAESVGNGSGIYGPLADVSNSRGIGVNASGISAGNAINCTGISSTSTGLAADGNADNCIGKSTTAAGMTVIANASNCLGTSSGLGIGLSALNATNCSGSTSSGSSAMSIAGTASFCRGARSGGVGISAAIAIGCTTGGGSTITSAQKHLGTP